MDWATLATSTMVYVHVLLFVAWLGGDIGVFVLGQHFRKRHDYSLDQRLALLKLLVIVDLAPRAAWAPCRCSAIGGRCGRLWLRQAGSSVLSGCGWCLMPMRMT
jgi:hypothetical protein